MTADEGPITDPKLTGDARALRVVSRVLEAGLFLVLAGSAAAFGAVHPESYRWVWLGGLLLGGLAAVRGWIAARLRRSLGGQRLALDSSGEWHRHGDARRRRARWSVDLGPTLGRAPLLLPGGVFFAWVLLQLLPLPAGVLGVLSPARASLAAAPGDWLPLTVAPSDTRRGLAFLAVALLVHAAAAAAMAASGARRRLLRGLALLGLALSLVGLVQLSLGVQRIYGVFEPLEGGSSILGPFVNRNHFAGYMLMVIPAALAVAVAAFRGGAAAAGHARGWRRLLLTLDSRDGVCFVLWMAPVLATTGALVATQSRGALLAFLLSLALLAYRLRRAQLLWIAAFAAAAALSGLSLERLHARFARTGQESLLRTVVWRDALERTRGFRWTGTGFNTYASAVTRVDAWALPAGATPWPPAGSPTEVLGPRAGFRILPGVADGSWYRELHNDYLQALVETGVPGVLLVLWAAVAALRAARQDAWVLAALSGVLLHEVVEFDLQIPALALLFVTLAAAPRPAAGRDAKGPERP